jgi:catechol 2,3-dioxygenase-like lactoylglutathione lyase family enzyme
MKIKPSNLFVDDQEKALRFYTDVLGFVKKHNIPLGVVYRSEPVAAGITTISHQVIAQLYPDNQRN